MQYNAPFGSADANAPFQNGNAGLGVQGSIPPAEAIEYTQREIVAAIAEAGLTPTNTDLSQLLRAVRGGQLATFTDQSTVANSLIIKPTTAHTALVKGLPLRVFPALTNTATAVALALSSLAPATLTRRDGTAPAVADLLAGCPYDVVFDGTRFRHVGLLPSDVQDIIKANYSSRGIVGFYSVGTYNWAVPAGVYRILVKCVGGAGGGGGTASGSGGAAGGGGAGGVSLKVISVTPGQVIPIVVGQGGVGGVGASNSNGAAGSLSSFGAFCSATGGAPGIGASSGGAAGTFGTSGIGSGGDVNLNGGYGTAGAYAGISGTYLGMGGTGGANPLGGGVTAGGIAQGASGLTGTGGAGGANGGGGGTGGSGCIEIQLL